MESIKTCKIEKVRLLNKRNSKQFYLGTLYLTATHLIFIDPDNKKESWILLMHIATVEKLPLSVAGSSLFIRCKTFFSVTFVIPKEKDCLDMFHSILKLSLPESFDELFCFHYASPYNDLPKKVGWNFFDLQAEFQRMGVPSKEWQLCSLNKTYELCSTYPQNLYVPASVTVSMIKGSSYFRSRSRLPVLTYLYSNGAAICRSSQPLAGFNARCVEDEQLLYSILRANHNSKYMYVIDTRPKFNAIANKAKGKGYENENFYENIKFCFFGIENIHVMRSSLARLMEACEQKQISSFLNGLASSGWLRHIKILLDTAYFIAEAVRDGISVVVHCSDGWDRTTQACSLAELILDPHYRTVQGYQALIEKEWLSFGHKFTDRCGLVCGDSKEESPIFTQFLDCTWQLLQMFPSAFQFNHNFLLCLHDHVYSAQYGTFLGNCEKERLNLHLSERTYSLWGFIATRNEEYLNPLYLEGELEFLHKEYPITSQSIVLWKGMYMRYDQEFEFNENLDEVVNSLAEHTEALREHLKLLEKNNRNGCGEPEILKNRRLEGVSKGELASMCRLQEELNAVALNWTSLRNVRECVCTTPLDQFRRKVYHCWHCGKIYCTRCIVRHSSLPGLDSKRSVPLCRSCFKELFQSNEFI